MRLGLDLLPLGALDRLHTRAWFTSYAFADVELGYAATLSPQRRREFLAGRFAAKEAVLKVLAVGLFEGVVPRDIAVVREAGGTPRVTVHGSAADAARDAGVTELVVSITHAGGMVAAVAAAW